MLNTRTQRRDRTRRRISDRTLRIRQHQIDSPGYTNPNPTSRKISKPSVRFSGSKSSETARGENGRNSDGGTMKKWLLVDKKHGKRGLFINHRKDLAQ